jgi:Lon protease-like protein
VRAVDPSSAGAFRDIAPALDALPLFPLPTVLFPGALLPLHVFEPRYRVMMRDILETHRTLAVVFVTDPDATDEHGHPAIAQIAGVGVIADHNELPGGRLDILVRGRARVRLKELPFVPPYRRAAATLIPAPSAAVPPSDLTALLSAAAGFAARVRERDPEFELTLPKDAPAAQLADLCAHYLVLDSRERQAILETLEPAARIRRVTDALVLQRLALSGDHGTLN